MKTRFVISLVIVFYVICLFAACATKNQGLPPKTKFGYVDMYGNEIIPLQYDWAYPFSEGLAAVSNGKKYGFIDKEGKVQIPFDYDIALCFREGLAVVGRDKKIGYITREGEIAIPFEYEGGANFKDGIAGVVKNGKLGYIDMEGNVVIDFIYDNVIDIGHVSDGLIPVELNKKWGYIDVTGAVKIPFEFHRANTFHAGRAYVSNGNGYGFIDINGDVIVPLIYQYTITDPYKIIEQRNAFLEGALYSIDYSYAYIGILTETYRWRSLLGDRVNRFANNYALVRRDDKYGFIDPEGNIVVPLEYDDATEIAYGMGYVARKDDDKTEWFRFTLPDFDLVLMEEGLTPFYVIQNGDTSVRNEHTGKIGFLDKNLNYIEFSDYDGIGYTIHGFTISLNKKIGMIDFDGNILIPPVYDLWSRFSEGMVVVGRYVE
jgi:hypothetical protein